MKNNKKNIVGPLVIGVATSILFTSCSHYKIETGAHFETLEPSASLETIVPIPQTTTNKINEETVSSVVTTDIQDNNSLSPSEIYYNELENFKLPDEPIKILTNQDKYSSKEIQAAGYQQIKKYALPISYYKEQLHNVLVLAHNPQCVPTNVFYEVAGFLYYTLDFEINPFMAYYELAKGIHELECLENHTIDEWGVYTCNNLQNDYQKTLSPSIEDYLDEHFIEESAYQRIKKALDLNPTHNMQDYLIELENLIDGQKNPRGLSEEEWDRLFKRLSDTLAYKESLYDVYIELAVNIHNLLNPDDILIQNEYGIFTSRVLKPGIS